MPWIDAHLDLAYLGLGGRDLRREHPDSRTGCVSLPALRAAECEVVCGTIFTDPTPERPHPCAYHGSDDLDGAEAAGRRQLELYLDLEAEGELSIVRTRADLERPRALPAIVLLMEGADPIRSAAHAAEWYDAGVRVVGLTWAMGTRYAGGNGAPGPLTAAGRDLVASLDEAGFVHDVSHLADEAFTQIMESARGPIIASHSNCRALVGENQRHLTDDQLRALADRGAVIGLNLFSKFLVPEGRAQIADCVAHLEHATATMGHRDGVGLGSDADGGFTPLDQPIGLEHHRDLVALDDALRTAGWSETEREGFRHANWRRFLLGALPAG
jgi:membrane dipeptidase